MGSLARPAVLARAPPVSSASRKAVRGLRCAPLAASATASELSAVDLWGDDKRIQTQTLDVADGTRGIRSLDWDRDRFDIEFGLQNGTTYNSFLIYGDKTALVDASHEKFRGLYLETLREELAAAGRSIDYILCSHTEPDHSGLIPDVLDMYPDAVVVGSKVALAFLQNLTHRPFQQQQVKGGDRIDLGGGHDLEFVMAPNLHWPDTMFSYDHGTGVMYTCDAFGMHYCDEEPFDHDYEGTLKGHYRFYYDCLMKPNARSVLGALRKVSGLPYTTIATGHGPLLHDCLEQAVGDYKSWSEAIGKAEASVAVLYCADYGVERLPQTIGKGVTKTEVAAEMVDLLSIDGAELRDILGRNQGVVIMTPPSGQKAAAESLAIVLSSLSPKKHRVMIAEAFGGNDEPVDTLQTQVSNLGIPTFCEPLRVREEPTFGTYQTFEETATDLAQALSLKQTIAKQKGAMTNDVAKAIARVSTGLYIVTASQEGGSSAMVDFTEYRNRFTMPQHNTSENLYYSYNLGPVHFLIYSSELFFWPDLYGHSEMKRMHDWMEADLKQANKDRAERPWIIAMGHRPMYCAVSHELGICDPEYEAIRLGIPSICTKTRGKHCYHLDTSKQWPIERLFFKHGVDMVLNGHKHDYERYLPVFEHKVYSQGCENNTYTNPLATVHITTGAAGNKQMQKGDPGKVLMGSCTGDAAWCHTQSGWYPQEKEDRGPVDFSYTRIVVHNDTHLHLEQFSSLFRGVIDTLWIVQEHHGDFQLRNPVEFQSVAEQLAGTSWKGGFRGTRVAPAAHRKMGGGGGGSLRKISQMLRGDRPITHDET